MRARAARCSLGALLAASVFVACQNDGDHDSDRGMSGGVAGSSSARHAGGSGQLAGFGGASTVSDAGQPSAAGEGGGLSVGGVGGGAGQSENTSDAGAAGVAAPSLHRASYPQTPYPAGNPDSDGKALLGKILFWEEQLGGDNTVACGTCHRPNAGGSDPRSASAAAAQPGNDQLLGTADDVHGSLGVVRCNARAQHTGLSVQLTVRKAPTYLDAMFAGRLFWDGRAECSSGACPSFSAFEDPDHPGSFPLESGAALENQAVGPPLSPVEMACEGATWSAIHQKLVGATPLAFAKQIPGALVDFIAKNDHSYPKLFQAAFGSEQSSGPADEINTRRIAFALATHERRLRSDQTPWDRWNAGDDTALSGAQLRGLDLFTNKARCELCHQAPTFADGAFHFTGFREPAWDLGRKAITPTFGVPGAVRTPTLRNVGLREATGLLHSGTGSLSQIVDVYDKGGVVDDPAIVAVPIDATIRPLSLSRNEKADLLDFLQHGLEDPRVKAQNLPFDRPLLSTE